jgi:hypothetical protein
MAYDFLGSIAQLFIQFTTQVVTLVVPGENYYKIMLFAGHTEASALLTTVPAIGGSTEITSATYASLTKGRLLTDLTDFFAVNSLTTIIVVIYDDTDVTEGAFPAGAVTALTTQFNLFKDRAYFKMMTLNNNIPANSALATLCYGDSLLSQCWISANDAQMIVEGSSTSMYAVCRAAGSDPVIVYHPTVAKNGALIQLGLSLTFLNTTGTPVGNSLDYLSTDAITPSGTAGANLTAALVTLLGAQYVGFFLTGGDGTGDVALKCGRTIKGNLAAGQWVVAYINYCSAVKVANYLTKMNRFKNNESYQGILLILQEYLTKFSDIGRLSNVVMSAPTFQNLPSAVGDLITVPNAWSADYNDNVRKANVQGTLYITQG